MNLSLEQLEQIEEVVFESGFSVTEVANYLKLDPIEIRKEYQNRQSKFYAAYQRGLLRQKYDEDKALSESAKGGDTIAVQVKMKRIASQAYEVVRGNLIDGELWISPRRLMG